MFSHCKGRIVVTCFASNIHRVQQVVHAAAANGRKVALVGRSMRKNINIGRSLGHIDIPEGMLVPPREIDQLADEKIVVISTGSQGEPLSALRRMAYRDHPQVELKRGDTVVFSATPIPGNERAVNETIDRLYHIGCEVVTARDAPIHASGHGYAEEVKMMINLTRPKYVMPVHGDFKRMLIHSQLAEAVGVPAENIFRTENGTPLEIDAERRPLRRAGAGGHDLRRRRRHRRRRPTSRCATAGCSPADGIFIIVATVSEQDGSSVVPPEVLARGVPFLEGNSAFIDELREAVEDSLDRAAEQQITEVDVLQSLPARRPRDVHLRAAQAPPDGLAGRRRGLTASAAAIAATTTSSRIPAPATAKAVRGEPRATIAPPSRKPTPGIAAPSDSSRPGHPRLELAAAWPPAARSSPATHWTPLPAPPSTEISARDQQRPRLRHARGRRARPRRWRSGSSPARTRFLSQRNSRLPSTMPAPQAREQDAEAGARRAEALLGVDDLDRDDEREADQRERLADQQRAHGPVVARELEPVDEALVPRRAVLVLGPGQVACAAQHDRDHQERRGVDQQRGRQPEGRDQPARRAPRRTTEEAAKPRFISALPSLIRPLGCSSGRDRAAREPAAGDRQRAVDQRRAASTSGRKKRSPSARNASSGEHERLDARRAPAASCAARTGPDARSARWRTARAGTSRPGRTPAVGATDLRAVKDEDRRARRPRSSPRGR